MQRSILRAAAAVLGFLAVAATSLDAAEGVQAVETPGSGTFTMCRNRLIYRACSSYHHIAIPRRLAVGDTVPLEYGSNPKEYAFPVARILPTGGGCMVLSQPTGSTENVEKIEVAHCRVADGAN